MNPQWPTFNEEKIEHKIDYALNTDYSYMKLRSSSRYIFGFLVIVGIILVLSYPGSRQFLNNNSGAVSGTLSAFLILLYFAQYRTNREQQQLMEANHKPVVEIEDYTVDEDRLVIELSNFGNGVGRNLELVVLSVFKETDNVAPDISTATLTRQPEDPTQHRQGQSIKPGEDRVSFEAQPTLKLNFKEKDGLQNSRYSFKSGIPELGRQDVGITYLYFYIRYEDLLGKYYINKVLTLETNPESELNDFAKVYKDAGIHPAGSPLVDQPTVIPTTLSFDLSDVEIHKERKVM
ncbi:hypothetical protein [Halomicrococcus sp. NG-SE-24]|uniref:hypothetical protein n=1 Tax=Halomicrococcus sp. NG-SE-24 TaxID=3436928 RepID=UPI003D96492C